ncbi:MAG: class I cytochrome c [Burkholderiales bacterium]|nr:class I cytochrome c [Burkholderiales bacterium]
MQCKPWVLAAGLAVSSGAALAQVPDALQVRGLAASCSGCHGTAGVAQEGMESLAGASRDDLLRKLQDFKSGKKPATVMHQLVKGYTDEQLAALAQHFSSLKK